MTRRSYQVLESRWENTALFSVTYSNSSVLLASRCRKPNTYCRSIWKNGRIPFGNIFGEDPVFSMEQFHVQQICQAARILKVHFGSKIFFSQKNLLSAGDLRIFPGPLCQCFMNGK